MKRLNKYLFAVILSAICSSSIAQINDARPKIYTAYPATLSIEKSSFFDLLNNNTGSIVALKLSDNFTFTGTVFSNITKYNAMQTVMIRSADNPESVFQITKIENKDNTISFSGRILNNNAADGYEIKNTNGEYFLQKFETAKLLQPCKL
jgi:hypothetical protein